MTILTKNLMLGWFSCEANIVNHRKKKNCDRDKMFDRLFR